MRLDLAVIACVLTCVPMACGRSAEAEAGLLGMARKEVIACAAWPPRTQGGHDTEILSFVAADALPDTVLHPPAGNKRRYCTVVLTLRRGSVEKVEYRSRSRGMMINGDRCAYALDRCVANHFSE